MRSPRYCGPARPGGYVTNNAYERIAGEIIARPSEELPVDAVYLDLHGAMVSEEFEDGEGELLRRVRAVVGEDAPIRHQPRLPRERQRPNGSAR